MGRVGVIASSLSGLGVASREGFGVTFREGFGETLRETLGEGCLLGVNDVHCGLSVI